MSTYNIEQADGAGAAGEGKALADAWLGKAITVTGTSGGIGSTWEHSFLDKPPGSAAEFLTPDAQTATFTPDVAGDSYRIKLVERISNGPTRTVTKVIRVTKDENGDEVNFGICSVSFNEVPSEANYGSNTTGYIERMRKNDAAVVAKLAEFEARIAALEAIVNP